VILGRWTLDSSPIYVAMDLMSRLVSPYDLNPMGKNPLRAILAETINFERLAQAPTKLFITQLMSGPAVAFSQRCRPDRRDARFRARGAAGNHDHPAHESLRHLRRPAIRRRRIA
jgi:hypothetical protein